jgi:tetratricopeptide (TPR) repeat protein
VPAAEVARHLASAEGLFQQGKLPEAERICQQLLLAGAAHPGCHHLLALIALRRGDAARAIDYLRLACNAPDAPALYWSNLAEVCRMQKRFAEGEAAARAAIERDPNFAGAWVNLGILEQESGKVAESLASLAEAARLAPQDAAIQNNTANSLAQLGHFEEAKRHWQEAIRLKPDYAEAYGNLGHLHKLQGNHQLARACLARAIEINPRLPDAYVNMASLELEHWRTEAARDWLSRLMRFAPDHVPGLAAMSSVLQRLERHREALRYAERAVQLAPRSQEAFEVQARALLNLGRFEEALESFDAAIALPGLATERIMVFRAAALIEHGQMARARAELERALEKFPGSPSVLQNLARVRTFSVGDPMIGEMRVALEKSRGVMPSDEISLHFALGKALLETADVPDAFAHFAAGNRLKRSMINYDGEATRRWLQTLREAFTADLMQRHGGTGFASGIPIFVLGMPRSGTTLIEQILASHPAVHGAGELKLLSEMVKRIGGLPDAVPRFTPAMLRQLGADYQGAVARLAGGRPRVVDKMPINFIYAGLIHLILPEARIIHSRRNAIDTCLSCYTTLFADAMGYAYDLRELGEFYRSYEDMMAHWATVIPSSRLLTVDYESLVADSEGETRRMLAFLDLPWDEACRDFHRTERPVRTASVSQVRQPIYTSSAGKWRKYADHLSPLLDVLGER